MRGQRGRRFDKSRNSKAWTKTGGKIRKNGLKIWLAMKRGAGEG